jgi:hypothetical protein
MTEVTAATLKTKTMIGVTPALVGDCLPTHRASADRPDERLTMSMHAQWGFHPVRVVHSYKGTAKQGEQLVLFQIGGVVSTAAPLRAWSSTATRSTPRASSTC